MESFTAELDPAVYRDFSTTLLSEAATPFAMRAAVEGSASVTAIFTNAVFVGFVTVICDASEIGVVSNLSSSTTGCNTDCVFAKSGYDLI